MYVACCTFPSNSQNEQAGVWCPGGLVWLGSSWGKPLRIIRLYRTAGQATEERKFRKEGDLSQGDFHLESQYQFIGFGEALNVDMCKQHGIWGIVEETRWTDWNTLGTVFYMVPPVISTGTPVGILVCTGIGANMRHKETPIEGQVFSGSCLCLVGGKSLHTTS